MNDSETTLTQRRPSIHMQTELDNSQASICTDEKINHECRVCFTELGTEQSGVELEKQPHVTGAEKIRIRTGDGGKRAWKETLLRFGPLSGIFALVIALLSTTASLGILMGSDYSEIYGWTAPPATFIAIFTAIGNLSIRYAAIQGVIVAWWIGALRGSSLQQLHWKWYSGTSIRGAITSGRNMGWLGLACIFSTIVTIDGPLFQRASTVMELSYKNAVTLERSMVPELPTGYTGGWGYAKNVFPGHFWSYSFNKTLPTPKGRVPNNIFLGNKEQGFYDPIRLWYQDGGYPGIVQGCPGECTGKLVAPALAVKSCASHTLANDYRKPWSRKDLDNLYYHAPSLDTVNFAISTELVVDEQQEQINAITGFSTNIDCNGTFEYTTCTLESAIGEYDITIRGDQTTLDSAANPKILSLATNAPVEFENETAAGFHQSTLGGVAGLMWVKWDAYWVSTNISGILESTTLGTSPFLFAIQTPSQCPNFTDPRTEYMASMNKLMVYFGMAATQGIRDSKTLSTLNPDFEINTTTTGYVHKTVNVYHTDYSYLVGALVLEALCVCLITPTYWGWSKLGRSMSFSPLEIAKAFDAPILADLNSQSSGRDIARASKDRLVQYGAVSGDGNSGKSKLTFCYQSQVERPSQGCWFDV